MRRPFRRLISLLAASAILTGAGVVLAVQPATAAAEPSFKVTCYPTAMAPNDPIVFLGQAGKSHMHSFYGAKGMNENATLDTLLAKPSSQCGSYFDTVDLSAYWIPTLYQNGQAVYNETGAYQLQAYYKRAGGPNGVPVAQAFPRGLKMIAGDMHATTPQENVTYVCAKTDDTGDQRGGGHEFMSCGSDEVFIAKLTFPDCWDGVNLDSADHKSHMAYSTGDQGVCPSDHPVKLPQLTFEAWYFGVNGDASTFSWASGGAYSFHGDVISAWDTKAAANLVNQCINVAYDCNPLLYPEIPQGSVTQAQIDAQLVSAPTTPAPAPSPSADDGMTMPMPSDTATATPSPSATETASPTPSPTSSHRHRHRHQSADHAAMAGMAGMDNVSSETDATPGAGIIPLVGMGLAVMTAIAAIPLTMMRRRRRRG